MHRTEIAAILLVTAIVNVDAQAQMATLHYKVGNVAFTENIDQIHVQSAPPVNIEVLPGGKPWPPLRLDELGRIFAGAVVIDPTTGKLLNSGSPEVSSAGNVVKLPSNPEVRSLSTGYEFRHRDSRCTIAYKRLGATRDRTPLEAPQEANVKLAASDDKILALVTSFLADGQTTRYHVHSIDPRTCKLSSATKLASSDLLVELGRSRQGSWWITGSVEQTLMASTDGQKWHHINVPEGLWSLVSSYIVNIKQISLAGILDNSDDYPNLLIYSADGGATWTNLRRDDPLLDKVPAGWLEGQNAKSKSNHFRLLQGHAP